MTITNQIKDLLFPRRCAICDDVLTHGRKYICRECRPKIVYIKEPYCMKCGKALSEVKEYCNDCLNRSHMFIQGSAVFDYGAVAGSLYRFKNKGRVEYAEFYARALYSEKAELIRALSPDAFIPVPIHLSKLKSRGYNQSEIISKELSKLTSIPTNTTLITRVKKTIPLKNLGLRERQNNLKNAFKVNDNGVKLKTIIIIDDIYTTGSTMDAMASAILEVMNVDIYFLTVTIGRGI